MKRSSTKKIFSGHFSRETILLKKVLNKRNTSNGFWEQSTANLFFGRKRSFRPFFNRHCQDRKIEEELKNAFCRFIEAMITNLTKKVTPVEVFDCIIDSWTQSTLLIGGLAWNSSDCYSFTRPATSVLKSSMYKNRQRMAHTSDWQSFTPTSTQWYMHANFILTIV